MVFGTAAANSCSFNFELTSQRTALENQILGNYKELDDDLIVSNYDRRITGDSADNNSNRTVAAIEKATKNRAFNADDIDELKDQGILGEDADSLLALLPKGIGDVNNAIPDQIKLAEVLIDEENRDRAALWAAEIARNPVLSEKDLPEVRQDFGRKLYEKAPKGHWFYTGNRWTPKP
jgi:uncharacterized protein YdbL (DUF1318 family)